MIGIIQLESKNRETLAMTSDFEFLQSDHDVVLQTVLDCVRDELEDFKVKGIVPDSDLVELDKKYALFMSLCFNAFIMKLEDKLGVQWTHEEIREIFHPIWESPERTSTGDGGNTPSKLTIAALADFIRVRIKPVSFEPVSVLGSPPCPAAGYFVGMSELVQRVRPDAERFGPSTPIMHVLPSRSLQVFWWRLSRAAGRSLPELSFWLNHLANVLLIVSAACLAFGVLVDWAFLAAVWLLCLKGIQFGWWLHRRANPLPQGIVTFGDLARHLAGQKEIPPPRSLSRRLGSWVGRTLLRRRPAKTPLERTN